MIGSKMTLQIFIICFGPQQGFTAVGNQVLEHYRDLQFRSMRETVSSQSNITKLTLQTKIHCIQKRGNQEKQLIERERKKPTPLNPTI